jgi:multicomponent Na+:H+ antiporter subunit A
LLFLYYSAPDLAITQLMVEALSVVLLLMVVGQLPAVRIEAERWQWVRDVAVATIFGGLMGLLALSAVTLQLSPSIASTLSAWSYPEAHGRNVVNVILVDFRALDTLGEIAVLAVASIGVAALLDDPPARPSTGAPGSFILARGARILRPALLVLAFLTFYRGHHLPGGGFIGGLIAAVACALVGLGEGVAAARRALRWDPLSLAAAGLAVALAAGVAGWLVRGSLLAGLWLPEFHVPLLGAVHLGTPMLFDAGVFLTVLGFACRVLFSLQEADK